MAAAETSRGDVQGTPPTVSICIPTLNEEARIGRALASIAQQDFQREQVEVLIVDGGSDDRTLEVASTFSDSLRLRLLHNIAGEAERGKTLALEAATGELVFCLDADAWFPSVDALKALVTPLVDDETLAGSIAPYAYIREMPLWTRYLSCDEFQRDPLVEFLTSSIDQFLVEERGCYYICDFTTTRIPPIGQTTLYRRIDVDPHRWDGVWREVDHPAYLVKQGKSRFAYVRQAELAHEHCTSLRILIRKRIRNLLYSYSYIRLRSEPDYLWLDTSDRREMLRLLRWVLGTNLVLPRLVEGIYRAVVQRRWEQLLRPIAALAVTDALIAVMVVSRPGRQYLRQALSEIAREG
jgi:glycosyltransferase involved in cell wall biosynthesis